MIQEKINEKLIKELDELKKEYSSLKVLYEKNVTGRKQSENTEQKNEGRVVAAIQTAGLFLYEEEGETNLNRKMHFLETLTSMRALLGIPQDQDHRARDYWIEHINREDMQNIMLPAIQKFENEGQDIVSAEYRYEHDKRGVLWFRHTAHALQRNEEGHILLLVGAVQDITDRKLVEEELIKAKIRAEESDRLKSAFLANMSHEIRTPMNGILGFSELLMETDLSGEQQKEYIEIIEKNGIRMLNIINDIIDISKIEAGLMNIDIKEIDINKEIEFIHDTFKYEVAEKGMQLVFKNTLPTKEATIRTDKEKVYSVLTNLLKNAIKFSHKGTIELGYLKRDEMLEFYVRDAGFGIPKDRQAAIFERFIQATIDDKMARQGAGLGLSISKAYVEMLGGKIWVESEEGIGSTFFFTLPHNAETEK